ncbi:hypothetical protein J2847_006793 [Azospirillum agricola]|nr:hypothetical protein [Azospirillum agricola]
MPLSGSPGAGGVTAGDALGAVGYGFNAFQNFKSGNTIGGVGNLAATAMMFIPGAQPFAPLVAIGSQLLGGLFGKDRGTPTAAATVTYSGTNQVASSYNQDNDGSLEQAQQLLSSIDAATKQFITAASGATNGEFGIGVEGRDGRFKARTLTGELPGDFGSLDEAVIAGFKANVGKGLISASDDVLKAIGTSTKTDINEWLGDVSFAKTFRPQFDSLMANLDPVSNQIKTFTEASKQLGEQVQANIVEWRDTASRLGLATGSELTTAARRGIEAMMGLGPVTQPLVGMAAASKQAEIQFEAFRPALASLGYTAEEVADMATRYTAKLTTAYSDAVGLLQRQAGVQVSGLSGRGASLSAADTFRAAGATVEAVTAPAFAALTDGLDGLTAAARRGALTYADVEAGWRALNQAVYEGVLTADQYTTAVGLLTTAYQDSQTVLSTLRQGWTSVQAITEPHRQPTATDVLDGAMVRGGGAGVLAFATQLDGLFTAIQGGTASFGDLAYTYERAADLFRAGTITGEQFTGIVSSMTTAWTKAADAAKALTAYQSDLNSRMYTGVGAARTAGLLSLDQQQAVELAQARDAGYDTTLLQQVLASERGQKAFDLAKADVLGYYDQQISATQDLITSLQDGAVAAAAVARQFRQAYDSLALDDSSPLSAYEKLIEARRQFDEAYSTATSDTASDTEKTEAQQQLQQLGPTLVSLAQAYYANSNRDDYDRIRSLFDRLGTLPGGANPATADRDLQVAQDTLKELQRQRADAARLGERQYGKLDDLSATMNQSYAVWQASLVALQRLTNTPSAATLPQMLAGMTRETLPDVVTWAKAQGADTLQQVLVAADKRFGWENNPYRYRAPDDVATMEGTGFTSEDALGFLRQFGYAGGFDSNANAFIAAHGIGDQYTAFLRDFKARNSVEGKRTRLAAFTDAQIEAAFGGMADIQAARSVDPGFNLRRWFEAYGINEVLSGARSIPGFAKGTLSTPPGAKWVGEHGAELVWDGGGAAVASSADSMRIASLWESAANDRWSGPNIASLRAHRPEPSGDAALVAMLERKLDTVTAELKALRAERSRDARDQVALTEAAATETIAGQGRMLAALRLHHDEERAA